MVSLTVPEINQSPSKFRHLVERDSVSVPVSPAGWFYPVVETMQDLRRYKEFLLWQT